MLKPEDVDRATLAHWKVIAQYAEMQGGRYSETLRSARYSAAVYAEMLNGDGCRFPACECPQVDCQNRPDLPAPELWPQHARPTRFSNDD